MWKAQLCWYSFTADWNRQGLHGSTNYCKIISAWRNWFWNLGFKRLADAIKYYIYIYIYTCVCVFVCVNNIYKYIYQSVRICCEPYRTRHEISTEAFPTRKADRALSWPIASTSAEVKKTSKYTSFPHVLINWSLIWEEKFKKSILLKYDAMSISK